MHPRSFIAISFTLATAGIGLSAAGPMAPEAKKQLVAFVEAFAPLSGRLIFRATDSKLQGFELSAAHHIGSIFNVANSYRANPNDFEMQLTLKLWPDIREAAKRAIYPEAIADPKLARNVLVHVSAKITGKMDQWVVSVGKEDVVVEVNGKKVPKDTGKYNTFVDQAVETIQKEFQILLREPESKPNWKYALSLLPRVTVKDPEPEAELIPDGSVKRLKAFVEYWKNQVAKADDALAMTLMTGAMPGFDIHVALQVKDGWKQSNGYKMILEAQYKVEDTKELAKAEFPADVVKAAKNTVLKIDLSVIITGDINYWVTQDNSVRITNVEIGSKQLVRTGDELTKYDNLIKAATKEKIARRVNSMMGDITQQYGAWSKVPE